MKYVVSNFASWKKLNEAESPGRTKQTAGIGQKVVGIPIDDKSFKVKIVHDLDVLDAAGKMTPDGWKSIYNWIMAQPKWPLYYTGLKDLTNNFVIYSVNKDNDRKQLITFVIAPRTSAPGLPAETQIARQEDLATLVKDPQKVNILDQQTKKAEDTKVDTNVGGGTAAGKTGYVAGQTVKLTSPISFEALKTMSSGQPVFELVKAAYLQMQNNPAIKKLTFFSKLKDELKSGTLGDNAVLLMKGIIAGFTLNDEYGDLLDQVTQPVIDKLSLFVPAQTAKKNESKYYLGLDGKRIYEQSTTVVQQAGPGLPDGFNLAAFSKTVGGAPAEAVTTGDIKVPDGGFKKGSVAKGDAEFKKVQQLIIDKFAKKLANLDLYKKFASFKADGNYGPTSEKMIAFLQGGFKLPVNGTIVSSELINKIQTNKIDESYLGIDYRIVEQFDMDAANATLKTYTPKPSSSTEKKPGVEKNIDINKIALVEKKSDRAFAAALIRVAINTLGKDWGPSHMDWLKKQCTILSNLNNYSAFSTVERAFPFLADPMKSINALTGGDSSLKDRITALGVTTAGSAKTADQAKGVLSAIHTKLDESFISQTDENSMIAAIHLISPLQDLDKLIALAKSLGFSETGLMTVYNEIDSSTRQHYAAIWPIGALNGTADSYKGVGFNDSDLKQVVKGITDSLI